MPTAVRGPGAIRASTTVTDPPTISSRQWCCSHRPESRRLRRHLRPAVAGVPAVQPPAERDTVDRGTDLDRERCAQHHRDRAQCRCPRLGLWTRADGEEQHHHRHQHLQREPRRLGDHDCQPNRRQRRCRRCAVVTADCGGALSPESSGQQPSRGPRD